MPSSPFIDILESRILGYVLEERNQEWVHLMFESEAFWFLNIMMDF